MTYESKFHVGQAVIIKDLDRQKAVVKAINIADIVTYQVAWFHDGSRHCEYLFGDELAADHFFGPKPAPPPAPPTPTPERMVKSR